jgi:hypothetical protein
VAAAAATLATRGARTRAALAPRTEHPARLAALFTARGVAGTARGLGHAVRRAWSPVLVPLAWRSRRIRLVLAGAVLGAALDERVRPRHVPVMVLDDALAALGTWASCLDQHTLRPLLPGRLRAQMASPPSTGTAAPVIPLASGPVSQTMAAAISSAVSSRSSGCCAENASADSSA